MADMFSKAAGLIRRAGSELMTTHSKVANKHTPWGVGKAAIGLYKDKKAEKKSEAGLNNIRAEAAAMLGQVVRQRNAYDRGEILTKPLIDGLNARKDLDPATRNAIFERDMKRRQQLNLPQGSVKFKTLEPLSKPKRIPKPVIA